MIGLLNIKTLIMKMCKRHLQLAIYYPKQIYDLLARREIKAILTRFNDIFYVAYPEKLHRNSQLVLDYHPCFHKKQHEVQRALKLCKTQKICRKELAKIEEYLNMQYIVEDQITYYDKVFKKAQVAKQQISTEEFSSFFPQLFEERISYLDEVVHTCLKKIRKLDEEKRVCEKVVYDIMHNPQSFLGRRAG